jgi:hypothetical protein
MTTNLTGQDLRECSHPYYIKGVCEHSSGRIFTALKNVHVECSRP